MHQFRTIFQDNLLIAASPDNDAKSPKLFWALPQSFETQNQACSKMIKDYISNIFLRLISWYFFHLCQCCCLQSTSLYFWCQVFGETLSLPIVGQVASSTISFFVFFQFVQRRIDGVNHYIIFCILYFQFCSLFQCFCLQVIILTVGGKLCALPIVGQVALVVEASKTSPPPEPPRPVEPRQMLELGLLGVIFFPTTSDAGILGNS